ncbi:MAG: aminotransferase class V-fold PLP-dependent enzyme [Gemmataceae bacterium]|nr:aminotransferase class V-fold PLP-dependent enzyme [Gemmataceae bacterium]
MASVSRGRSAQGPVKSKTCRGIGGIREQEIPFLCLRTAARLRQDSPTESYEESVHPIPAILGGPPAFPDGPPPWPPSTDDVRDAVARAMNEGTWGGYHGPHVEELERRLAERYQTPHVLTCSSGTIAVEAALRAVGVGPGDEVVLAAYEYESNFLTVHAIGARPVLVDVSAKNFNLDPARLTGAIGPKTKAILVSHLHGGIVPMDAVSALGVPVVEDCAQCPGAAIGPKPCGSFGTVGTLSFGGSKLLAAGRGGALLFQDERAYRRAKLWLHRGVQAWAALSELQSAVLLPQLERLHADTIQRAAAVLRIAEERVPGLELFENAPRSMPAYYKVGFRFDPIAFGLSRDVFLRAARAEGIAFDAGFAALHLGRSPSRFRAAGPLTEAARAGEMVVKLHHPVLLAGNESVEIVARTLANIYRNASEISAAFPPS